MNFFLGSADDGEHGVRGYDEGNEEPEPPHSSYLIIGRSNAGKSTLVKSLFKHVKKKILVVNDYTNSRAFEKITWPQVPSVRSSALIFEDAVSCDKNQLKLMRQVLCFSMHHQAVNPVAVLGHSIYRSGLYQLLPFFVKIFIMMDGSNIVSLRAICTFYGLDEKDGRDMYIEKMKTWSEKYCYLVYDVLDRSFKIRRNTSTADGPGEKPRAPLGPPGKGGGGENKQGDDNDEKARAASEKYLSILPQGKYAIALFSLLYQKLPKKLIDPLNLTVSLWKPQRKQIKGGRSITAGEINSSAAAAAEAVTPERSKSSPLDGRREKKKSKPENKNRIAIVVSLIDYLACLTSSQGALPLTYEQQKFHRYVIHKLKVCLPTAFVLNPTIRDEIRAGYAVKKKRQEKTRQQRRQKQQQQHQEKGQKRSSRVRIN
jgi:hypothetical protein